MTDKKITELNNLTGANLVDADEFVVVDISADETKAITAGQLKTVFLPLAGGTVAGDITVSGDVIISGVPPVTMATLGQSNMNGTTGQVGGSMRIPTRMNVWNGNLSAGDSFGQMALGQHPLDVTANGGVTYSNNLTLAFAREIRDRENRAIYMTQHARGSHTIEHFLTAATLTANGWSQVGAGFTDFGAFMYGDMTTALSEVPNTPTAFEILAISLGEANSDDTVFEFRDKAAALLSDLTDSGVIDEKTQILWSELPDGTAKSEERVKVKIALAAVQCSYPNLKIVNADGLAMLDSLHLTGNAIDVFGLRYKQSLSEQSLALVFPTIDQSFTPKLFDGSDVEFTYGSTSAHAVLDIQRIYDDNGRPLGVGGWANIFMEFTNINTAGRSGNIYASFNGLTIGSTGSFAVTARDGGAGKRHGSCFLDNVDFSGFVTPHIAGSSTQKVLFIKSASGAIDTQIDTADLTSTTADISLSIQFPMDIVTGP